VLTERISLLPPSTNPHPFTLHDQTKDARREHESTWRAFVASHLPRPRSTQVDRWAACDAFAHSSEQTTETRHGCRAVMVGTCAEEAEGGWQELHDEELGFIQFTQCDKMMYMINRSDPHLRHMSATGRQRPPCTPRMGTVRHVPPPEPQPVPIGQHLSSQRCVPVTQFALYPTYPDVFLPVGKRDCMLLHNQTNTCWSTLDVY
jgi:hypothetical protein